MEGRTFSHYKVLERLGGGGMGVVYKAEDTRLKRPVALKFLPPELTRDDEARQRFVKEAQAASALDHPNICTIHEIDTTPDGQMFIAMAFYEGETLKRRIERGALKVEEALDVAGHVARGLERAHESGIIHRDIKPSNIMLTRRGEVKIVDFGIAKLAGVTGPTRTGTTLGTLAYMSPEQINGQEADQQTDLWSLGAVVYEMLAGRPPFHGDQPLLLMNAIANQNPQRLTSLRPEIPAEVERLVTRALEKKSEARYRSAAEFLKEATDCHKSLTRPIPSSAAYDTLWPVLMTPKVAVPALLVILLMGAGAIWLVNRGADARWAREEAIPEIMRLLEGDRYAAAFALAEEAEPYIPNDPSLVNLWPDLSVNVSIATEPSGADVYVREYSAVDSDWNHLGQSPVDDVRLPRGVLRWRIEKAGYESVELAGRSQEGSLDVTLEASGSIPSGMIRIPASPLRLGLTGFNYQKTIPAREYLIDRYEVTNREFKEFIESGGYESPEYWKHEFFEDGSVLSWEEAMSRFRDTTGRPGPSTWEGGTYPADQEDYPVAGVSWYEATAYAEFRGKSLPSVYHWLGAAGTYALPAALKSLANLEGESAAPVGSRQAMSPPGTHDMAGNVKEWCWNRSGDLRYILGGGWSDPTYIFTYPEARPPSDRSPMNGFRLVEYEGDEATDEAFAGPIELPSRDYRRQPPVGEEVFQLYKDQFYYDPTPLDPVTESVDQDSEHWQREKITFNAPYGNERMVAYLYLPASVDPPYQSVIGFPGTTALFLSSIEDQPTGAFDFIAKSGRAFVFPIYKSTYERRDGLTETWPDTTRSFTDHIIQWVNDARRTIDYLETRDDIDIQSLAYYGISWGGRMGAIIPALEERFRTAILLSGALSLREARPEVNQVNFAPRVTIPVLMLNGRHDYIEPVDTAQRPLFELLGTPDEHKRHIIFEEAGHWPLPRNQLIKETLEWLDKYLGPVN